MQCTIRDEKASLPYGKLPHTGVWNLSIINLWKSLAIFGKKVVKCKILVLAALWNAECPVFYLRQYQVSLCLAAVLLGSAAIAAWQCSCRIHFAGSVLRLIGSLINVACSLVFSTPMAVKHVMLVPCNASKEWRGATAFSLLQENHNMEVRNQTATCLQVCMCTHVHTDFFKEMYPRLALLAGLQEMWKGLAMIVMVASSELESI